MKRRLERIEESIVRYMGQLDTADRRGDAVPEARVVRLKDKIVKLREEIKRLDAIDCRDDQERGQANLADRSGCAFDGNERQGHRDRWLQCASRSGCREPSHCGPRGDERRHGPPSTLELAEQARTEMGVETLDAVADRGYTWRRDQGLRGFRHHGDIAEANDLWRQGCWSLRQTGLRLCRGRGCLSLSCRRAADLPFHGEREGKTIRHYSTASAKPAR